MKRIDCKGLHYEKTLNRIKNYFDSIGEGEAIVFIDDEVIQGSISKYVMGQGYKVESNEVTDGYELVIEKRGCLEVLEEQRDSSILITTDRIGEGDDKLGKNLMISYFDTLSEEDKVPKNIVFLNGGVKLLTQGSKIIEGLELLRDKGVNIYCSEACLDNFELRDKLIIGKIVDMGYIVEIMNSSQQLIKL